MTVLMVNIIYNIENGTATVQAGFMNRKTDQKWGFPVPDLYI